METKKADIKEIEKYDTIILGGGIYFRHCRVVLPEKEHR